MTFVDGFYSFNLSISNVAENAYVTTRIKCPKHPLESWEHFYCRVLAYCHSYDKELQFTKDCYLASHPTLTIQQIDHTLTRCIFVGAPSVKSWQKLWRENSSTDVRVYLYSESDHHSTAQTFKVLKKNQPLTISCFAIDSDLLQSLEPPERTRLDWSFTYIDQRAYLQLAGKEYETSIQEVTERELHDSLLELEEAQ